MITVYAYKHYEGAASTPGPKKWTVLAEDGRVVVEAEIDTDKQDAGIVLGPKGPNRQTYKDVLGTADVDFRIVAVTDLPVAVLARAFRAQRGESA